MSQKSEWPELVGKSGEEAAQVIKSEFPGADTPIMAANSICTMDYRTNRVRIFIDENNKVIRAPHVA